jgi:hypothetical protein
LKFYLNSSFDAESPDRTSIFALKPGDGSKKQVLGQIPLGKAIPTR